MDKLLIKTRIQNRREKRIKQPIKFLFLEKEVKIREMAHTFFNASHSLLKVPETKNKTFDEIATLFRIGHRQRY
jgi:hypothetical protein